MTDCSLTTVFSTDLLKISSKKKAWGRYIHAKPNLKGDKIGLLKNRRQKLATENQGKGRLFY